ncbi:DUF1440 domain-containing protein [Novosphingobium sp. Leaf2]|uniref:DUF1440 domain-containing protein n=1 Tax=Novosphingobium sp. Leaf2 TaxID=1735670 RepID=UPI000AA985E6|nr:DUF1440 domain-containing protein [Novosphingobium sp. Leaf2]
MTTPVIPETAFMPSAPPLSAPNRVDTTVDVARGAAAGAVAGIAASAAMNGFQTLVIPVFRPDGGGIPATEKAADRASMLATGYRLGNADRAVGGEAVHYIVGALTGSLYGAMAEVRPGVTRWRGLALGLAAATLVDQIAVPLTGLARPPWRYTVRTHLYGYASHLVFGFVTEAVRKVLRERLARRALPSRDAITLDDIAVPLLLGLANGQRTFTPPAAVTIAAAGSGLGLQGTPLALLGSKWTGALMSAAAIGEYVADKQPGIPARISPPGLAGRAIGGALSGAAAARPGKSWLAAGLGAAGAVAGAYVSYRVRMRLASALGRDRPVAFAEDALSLAGAAAVAGYAAMRQKQRDRDPAPLAA